MATTQKSAKQKFVDKIKSTKQKKVTLKQKKALQITSKIKKSLTETLLELRHGDCA